MRSSNTKYPYHIASQLTFYRRWWGQRADRLTGMGWSRECGMWGPTLEGSCCPGFWHSHHNICWSSSQNWSHLHHRHMTSRLPCWWWTFLWNTIYQQSTPVLLQFWITCHSTVTVLLRHLTWKIITPLIFMKNISSLMVQSVYKTERWSTHLSKSNPHTVCLKARQTFRAISFSALDKMTG